MISKLLPLGPLHQIPHKISAEKEEEEAGNYTAYSDTETRQEL